LNFKTRAEDIAAMKSQKFDLAIIGGGITGAGVARDAASRGMKVALIEANDFASGTSSRSSKLIHGGIRYLENLEFHLVFEALNERRILFEIAPHLVHPLRFVLPVYKNNRTSMFKMGLGMWLYDALALFETPEMHERLDPNKTLERLPWLRGDGLAGAFAYSDAYMDDDRLVIETLRDAERLGARCANYVRAKSATLANDQVQSLEVEDGITHEKWQLHARHFVSCSGPWTDQVGNQLLPKWNRRLRPTKGIHLTFSRERFPLHDAVVMALEKDNRIVFAIPRNDMVIVGTTDTDYPGDPSDVVSESKDVTYLLNVANSFFPGSHLNQADILASYSGVRPLISDGAESESKTSREHVIFTEPYGMTFVAGGKYTTYRHMAEQTVEHCLRRYSLEDRVKFGRARTLTPLNPLATQEMIGRAQLELENWSKQYGLPASLVQMAIDRHGLEASDILDRSLQWRTETDNLLSAYWMAEADFAIDETLCLTPGDFYLRRSPLFLSMKDHGFSRMADIQKVFDEKLEEAIRVGETVQEHIRREMNWVRAEHVLEAGQ
jgi:glycerol-3-phosphate dehydrogenase